MATDTEIEKAISLAEFLAWDRIDETPYLEYLDGRIEEKMSPQPRHSVIEINLTSALNEFARPRGLGLAMLELRCTFGGRSVVPDVVFVLDAKIRTDENGELQDDGFQTPDIHVEIRSPGQSTARNVERIEHSLRHGCQLGWYLDPDQRRVSVHRPGLAVEHLEAGGFLEGAPVLPGFRLAVSEVFGWLRYREPRPEVDPS